MYDLIIIGGGPAGLTAAVYALRKRLECLLISPDLGGKANSRMAVEGVDTHRVINGADIVRRFQNEVEYLDFARLLEKVVRLEPEAGGFAVTTDSGKHFQARAVILATGVEPVRLTVPGAERFPLRGISYSTVSYAPLYIEKRVAVVGRDELALRGAAELAQIAKQVYLVEPPAAAGTRPAVPSALERRLRNSPAVAMLDGWQPVSVDGDTHARQLKIRSETGEEQTLDIDAIFVEMGLKPRTSLVEGWVELDEQKRVVVDCGCATNVPGLFAAGDVTQLVAEQVLIAVGEGAKAALNAYDYLLSQEETETVAA